MGEVVAGWAMNPVPIFIPFVNRFDLLQRAVDSIPLDLRWQAEVINNSDAPLPEDLCAGDCNPSVPLTASQSLNWMQKLAMEWWGPETPCPFYFFMHNDTQAGKDTIEKLYEMALRKRESGDNWAVIFTLYDTLAVFNTAAFHAIGPWDQNLPQYYVDNCMYRRLRLAGYELAESHLSVKHEGSATLHSDPIREIENRISFPIYRQYYAAKWGGDPGHETFRTPFNL